MKRTVQKIGRRMMAQTVAVLCLAACAGSVLQAEEAPGYYDDAGNWVQETYSESAGSEDADTEYAGFPEDTSAEEDVQSLMTGTYSVETGWSADPAASSGDKTVYKQDACVGVEDTSTISCSYMDTNYSVLEYEQLRDMLTNNLLYSNVNAQISTSAVYTQAKDYLYIVIVDDSAQEYKDIYYYVVGDYRCFCVEVREYRAEADQAVADGVKTPHEVGQTTAEEFTWDMG